MPAPSFELRDRQDAVRRRLARTRICDSYEITSELDPTSTVNGNIFEEDAAGELYIGRFELNSRVFRIDPE